MVQLPVPWAGVTEAIESGFSSAPGAGALTQKKRRRSAAATVMRKHATRSNIPGELTVV
jgi:hypothetical protein